MESAPAGTGLTKKAALSFACVMGLTVCSESFQARPLSLVDFNWLTELPLNCSRFTSSACKYNLPQAFIKPTVLCYHLLTPKCSSAVPKNTQPRELASWSLLHVESESLSSHGEQTRVYAYLNHAAAHLGLTAHWTSTAFQHKGKVNRSTDWNKQVHSTERERECSPETQFISLPLWRCQN